MDHKSNSTAQLTKSIPKTDCCLNSKTATISEAQDLLRRSKELQEEIQTKEYCQLTEEWGREKEKEM